MIDTLMGILALAIVVAILGVAAAALMALASALQWTVDGFGTLGALGIWAGAAACLFALLGALAWLTGYGRNSG